MKHIQNKWNILPVEMKVSIAFAFSGIIQKAVSFLALPLFSRILTTEQFGQLIVYQSCMGIITVLITLQLPYGSFSKAMVTFKNQRDEYISCVETICLCLAIFFLLLYIPLHAFVFKIIHLPIQYIILMVFEILCNAAIAFWSAKNKFEFKYIAVVVLTIVISILTPLLQLLLVINTEEKGYARIVGESLIVIICGGGIFFRCLLKGKKIYDKKFWIYALKFNIPLIPYYLSQIIFDASDRIMIEFYCGTSKAGIYGMAYNLAFAMSFILTAINNSYIPWFYQLIYDGDIKKNRFITNVIAIFVSFLLLILIWFAPETLLIIGGKSFLESKIIIPPIAISVVLLFYAQISANYEFYYESKLSLTLVAIISSVFNIITNAFLIPKIGYWIAGYTTMFSYIILVAGNSIARKIILNKQKIEDVGVDSKTLFFILLVFILLSIIGMLCYPHFWLRCIMMVLLCCVLIMFRRKLLFNYNKFISEIL